MRNTSESPDANEQAKTTPARSRTATRLKSEQASPISQEQEAKKTGVSPSSARRGSSTGTTPAHLQAAGGHKSAASDHKEKRVEGDRKGAPLQSTAHPASTQTQRQAPVQRQTGTIHPTSSSTQSTAAVARSGSTTQQRPVQHGQHATTTAHPGGNRPSSTQPGSNRAGGQARPGTAHPAGRNGTNGQRLQERRAAAVKEKPTGPISIPPQIIVKDLAYLLHATPNEVIRDLIKHSVFASINQVVDYDKAALVAQDLGFEPTQSALTTAPAVQGARKGLSANEAMMATRDQDNMVVIPPVVTIMGHVDHGKTSLLDTIRKTKVAAGEAGGITQHIGAYQVEVNGKKITFLDTPGHEAFTAMRARGAQVTHIAVIVVAADDGVMPQTREAIDHARAAKVPIIIALNKIDKIDANPDRVKQQLAEIGVVIEEYGGDVICVPVSARKGTGIDDLLEMILLLAEIQDIRANPNRPATGVIIEAKLEKNTGPTATVLIQQGTLKMGDNIVVGAMAGKVRAMFNDRGKRIQKAPPSTPVSILGLPEVPQAGDRLEVVADERTAKQMAAQTAEQRRSETGPLGQVSLDTLYMQMQEGQVKELNIVLKCDVQGSAEAIKNALTKIGDENLKVRLIHEGIGNINETDVHLAAASGAIIIGFNVKADGAAQRQAQKEGVDIRYYNIIYKLTDDIQAALKGMLEPTYQEVIEGHAEVQQMFKAGKNLVIAGCRVLDGKIVRSSQARITRKNEKVYDGKIASLRRGKDDVREVASGYECGIVLEDFTEFEIGDIIETYAKERVKPGA
ncbi:MAG TPA: translation initiation factor IF-2 [Ktedonobacteraceae bacterium]|jgi:translation initiation factor IF-2|nr:translation initiation factor IF-2 [Ktedonobacteraceae bacterium]